MIRAIYKLKFKTGVHFGNGSLTDSLNTFQADTLFSALCIESLKIGGEEKINKLVDAAKYGKIKISDSFPYISDTLFIPKPFMPIEVKNNKKNSSKEKKAYKKLKYLPIDKIDEYMKGKLEVVDINKKVGELGISEERTLVAIRGFDESEPYHMGVFRFFKDAGLYIIAEFNESEYKNLFDEIFKSLSYTGIGGKVSAGLGRFEIEEEELPKKLEERINNAESSKIKMSLSVCLPEDEIMEEVLEDAYYRIEKRGGFISSENYANTPMKKKDFYVIRAGGCFDKIFEGRIEDVSIKGKHPVYRYAKPLFMEVPIDEK